jgi:hypothetical protein
MSARAEEHQDCVGVGRLAMDILNEVKDRNTARAKLREMVLADDDLLHEAAELGIATAVDAAGSQLRSHLAGGRVFPQVLPKPQPDPVAVESNKRRSAKGNSNTEGLQAMSTDWLRGWLVRGRVLGECRRNDLLESANARRTAAGTTLERARFEEAIAARLPGDQVTVAEVLSNDAVADLYAQVTRDA